MTARKPKRPRREPEAHGACDDGADGVSFGFLGLVVCLAFASAARRERYPGNRFLAVGYSDAERYALPHLRLAQGPLIDSQPPERGAHQHPRITPATSPDRRP